MLSTRRRLESAAPRVPILLLACIGAPSAEIEAQDPLPVTAGERVRVTTESGATHWGRVGAVAPGWLTLQGGENGQDLTVPITSVRKLDVTRGQKSNGGVGLLVGAGVGVIAATLMCAGRRCNEYDSGPSQTPGAVLVLGLGGGLVGGIIGAVIRTDRWEEVPVRPQVSTSLGPNAPLRVSLSIPHGNSP